MFSFWFLMGFLALNALPFPVTAVIAWAGALCYVLGSLITRRRPIGIPRSLGLMVFLPLVILFLGTFGIYRNHLLDILKDLWYFSNPIIYIAFGYFVFEYLKSLPKLVTAYALIGVAASLYSIVNIYFHADQLAAAGSAEAYRRISGAGSGQAMIPVVLLIIARHVKLPLGFLDRHRAIRVVIYTLGSIAILLTLSRTLMVVMVSGILIVQNKKRVISSLLGFGFCVVILAAVLSTRFQVAESFLDKIVHSTQEVEVQQYDTFSEINNNWRGFEAYRAMKTFKSFPLVLQCFGGGFGTKIDIGFAMSLGGPKALQEIPILHNGYMYLLVKTGILGTLIFVLFLGYILRIGLRLKRSQLDAERLVGFVLTWTAFVFFFTQGVVTGIYNKAALAPNLILLGAVLASVDIGKRSGVLRRSEPFQLY